VSGQQQEDPFFRFDTFFSVSNQLLVFERETWLVLLILLFRIEPLWPSHGDPVLNKEGVDEEGRVWGWAKLFLAASLNTILPTVTVTVKTEDTTFGYDRKFFQNSLCVVFHAYVCMQYMYIHTYVICPN
jgi:hypothetical protein